MDAVFGRGMENSSFIDILILAMIAAFLVFRLRSALGRRTGHQRPPDRFPREVEDSGDTVIHLPERNAGGEGAGDADAPPPIPPSESAGDPDSEPERDDDRAVGLTQLKIADPSFEESHFLDGARGAFEMILDAFAGGDKSRLHALLADETFDRFAGEIDRRAAAGETLETTLVSFEAPEIADARVDGGRAAVTVRFSTEQVNLVRNEAGEVVDGDEAEVSRIVDIWTFERDLRSSDPNWRLAETRSGD